MAIIRNLTCGVEAQAAESPEADTAWWQEDGDRIERQLTSANEDFAEDRGALAPIGWQQDQAKIGLLALLLEAAPTDEGAVELWRPGPVAVLFPLSVLARCPLGGHRLGPRGIPGKRHVTLDVPIVEQSQP